MASEIKIHLATYLKDAGIKATQAQIDQLAKHVKVVNSEVSQGTDAAVRKLGQLPGVFGKLQSVVGGFGAQAMAVIAAFKVGWDIGTWINDKVIRPLFGIKDPLEELKKKNRELARQAEEARAAWDETFAKWSSGWDKEVRNTENARQSVEDLTQAYLKMQAARDRIQAAGDDATLLGLQRDKFNAMATAGTPDEAAAAGKYYDVLLAEEEAKQKLAAFDKQAETSAKKQAAAEEVLNKAIDKQSRLKQQLVELNEKIEYTQSQDAVNDLGFKKSVAEEEKLLKQRDALEQRITGADRDVANKQSDLDAMRVASQAEAQERQNIQERAALEVDERKKAYDDYMQSVEAADEARWRQEQEDMRRAVEAEQRERVRMEQQLAAQRIADLRAELSERQRAEGEAHNRQSAASSGLSQAWIWYRNQSSMQAVIDEKKAQAMAEAQWEKDFERLKFRRNDWRTAEFGSLSASDEAVRQVALAKEEKAAADKAVIETAENTRNLAEKLDALLQVKG